MESQLFGVKPTEPSAIVGATLLLTSAAVAAALIPAHRASAVNPIDALRFESGGVAGGDGERCCVSALMPVVVNPMRTASAFWSATL